MELYFWAAQAAMPLGPPGRAMELVDRAVALAGGSEERFDQRVPYLRLMAAGIAIASGDPERCEAELARAEAHARRIGDPELEAYVTAFQVTPLDSDGLARWDQALRSARDSGNLHLEGTLLISLSELSITSEHAAVTERGVAAGLAGSDVAKVLGSLDGQAVGLANAGAALLVLGSPEAAAQHLRTALRLATRVGDVEDSGPDPAATRRRRVGPRPRVAGTQAFRELVRARRRLATRYPPI